MFELNCEILFLKQS